MIKIKIIIRYCQTSTKYGAILFNFWEIFLKIAIFRTFYTNISKVFDVQKMNLKSSQNQW
jgi:hypothetical protein